MDQALAQVVYQHAQSLRRYAMARTRDPYESDDLVQECFKRALLAIRNGHKIGNPHAYLFATLRNLFSTKLARRRRGVEIVAFDDEAESLACPAQQTSRIGCRDLMSALARLPQAQKEVVVMIGMDGLSYQSAAEVLGIPIGTVMSRLSRGRHALKRLLDGAIREARPPGGRAMPRAWRKPMELKKLFDVTVSSLDAHEGAGVVIVLADGHIEARSLVADSQTGRIKSVAAYPGWVSAVGPSRIVGRFKTHSV